MPPTRVFNKAKPWLVTSEDELARDALFSKEFSKEYLRNCPFPGTTSTVEEKMEWLHSINAYYDELMEESFYRSRAPEAKDAVKKILMDKAPKNMRLDVIVKSVELSAVAAAMKEEEKEEFVKKFPNFKYGNGKTSPSLNTFDKCMDWIKINAKAELFGEYSDCVVLVSIPVAKESEMSIAGDTLTSLGLEKYIIVNSRMAVSSAERNLFYWSLQHKVGENMYTGINNGGKGKKVKYSISVGLRVPPKESELNPAKAAVAKAVKDFSKKLEDDKAAAKERDNPKMYMLVGLKNAPKKKNRDECDDSGEDSDDSSEEKEGDPRTAEFWEPLWLPASFEDQYQRISGHFGWGEGEGQEIQRRLEKGNTDSGNIKVELFEQELAYVRKIKSTQERFAATLALNMVIIRDNYWTMDNECSEDVARDFRSLATFWKNTVFKSDDSTLGIGLEDGTVEEIDKKSGVSHSRSLVYDFMESFAKRIEDIQDISKFNWKPPHKKRKSSEGVQGANKK
uniref:Uncharacterized protein n=1 Tax=Chaetoceros debilis TaxID=122233 RepID=A0A7S3Q9A8_9STRA|mmetsp:Transcript_17717/g.26824  ORF Transcript_17717/g.26824 Transcript_17717/m.26824 type:complete len:508 (-) Transcript_17717:119-1642(-)|eukprot:CAMPEP_0194076246 /NCGR_PEP_ID=MMETSP0149-20130528/3075_1 /TAXON_ID=122233 /ORGANISM="Chaetoceros debilis, Strain MM31A-1" /LENGTH=507 /DNA_ID=CAMNT_0038756937 /DNA_START=155 /DNA_END=1678 /DNA_ORIENTATION=-